MIDFKRVELSNMPSKKKRYNLSDARETLTDNLKKIRFQIEIFGMIRHTPSYERRAWQVCHGILNLEILKETNFRQVTSAHIGETTHCMSEDRKDNLIFLCTKCPINVFGSC